MPEFSTHTDGISKLVQGRGPGSFKSGTLHQLFTSFRVFMVLGAIQQRKETFLDEPRWKTTPFVSESKSFMQSLLDQVSGLPTLLQRLDLISGSGLGWQNNVIATLYNDYISQIISLESWGAELMLNSESNLLWWPVALSSNADTTFSIQYNFANILIANTISHYWGFLLILQISIETLRSISSKQGLENACPTKHSVEFLQDKTVEVANDICRGMDYHLQPEMKLYGPAATLFPINIALQVFRGAKRVKEVKWCEDFILKLRQMGVRLAPHVPLIQKNESGT
ncbi:hypothetical protein BGZ60DRAFT_549781 [Tricladium varicosporioides]|nr:hypothetical protein BGZ60DRAFT_549781 [Hymenoscyphus varicosporioides]